MTPSCPTGVDGAIFDIIDMITCGGDLLNRLHLEDVLPILQLYAGINLLDAPMAVH